MQCNYLGTINLGFESNRCMAGPEAYETTEEDRSSYCIRNDFIKCPRLITNLKIKEAEGKINNPLK